ncbi:MAG: hypothetical protein KJZ85_15625 [Rhodobacteraceae bacterium]|nr:hypothetical protein [Paracoccaceae bacterium]
MSDGFLIAVLIGLGAPAVTFVSLAALPSGTATRIGLAAAALVIGAIGLFALPEQEQGARIIALLFTGAVGLAALVQALRAVLPVDRPRWVYPAIVGLALAGGIRVMTRMLIG